ncbi:sigma-70 family RNA polymerase sigma factor [Nostoc linckia z18]|uniref:Sigma-70 family RNA polymerase sigma factor n=2 Tax=Nostoc linckia TaxID=92942 RepID=A0A9Q5ZHG0_NOSLI|nr:sigma-70 family RNA polymerase sigma factor [Nostoc linckia]PHK39499.1 sigma-70 family RNA polymerase sigma factor [Nostoc linckia z15]PHK45979.1 sigma-70 family RNA polymerase sigma factor [Nostoc linckia z16]PHJ67983.1 sigma-70 family RNA polymerase sigma factor [Nostoc linckia z1]PHJ72921.1 sigma-70 family RNA polymerase sigma factor [Nostoc linckia z3]PHJ77423.1 sigma-70 family RNA polymerase sigma factor [Nostoc linckia z2]
MQIPSFPEANHPLVKSLFHHSDDELLALFQQYPDAGKYFTVIFCRYSPIVYTLIRHSARSPVQADYLFALTWRHIYYELGGLNLSGGASTQEALTMQNWLINMTAFCINEIKVPPTEAIHYSLEATSPPLWCYVEQALDQLPPILRLIVLMSQTFHWSDTRIAAYLQAEGEAIAPNEVANFLQEGYRMLEDKLPTDIRAIYLGEDFSPA